MEKRTNEMARIIEFFDKVKEAYEKYVQVDYFGSDSVPDFYGYVFEVEGEMNKEQFCRMQLLYVDMLNETIQKVKEVWSEKVCAVIVCIKDDILGLEFYSTGKQIREFNEKCEKYKLQLELFEEPYALKYSEEEVDEEELKKIEQSIEAVLEDIRESNIDSVFKETMVEQLYMLKVSFEKYRIFGKKVIQKEVNALTGVVTIGAQQYQEGTEERKVLHKIVKVIGHILGVITDEGILIAVKTVLGIEG